jgi:hypothetical protein
MKNWLRYMVFVVRGFFVKPKKNKVEKFQLKWLSDATFGMDKNEITIAVSKNSGLEAYWIFSENGNQKEDTNFSYFVHQLPTNKKERYVYLKGLESKIKGYQLATQPSDFYKGSPVHKPFWFK